MASWQHGRMKSSAIRKALPNLAESAGRRMSHVTVLRHMHNQQETERQWDETSEQPEQRCNVMNRATQNLEHTGNSESPRNREGY